MLVHHFFRKLNIYSVYTINNIETDSKLDFREHASSVTFQGFKSLRYIICNCKIFLLNMLLYYCYVRSARESYSVV